MVSTITREELKEKIVRGDKFHLVEVDCAESDRRVHIPGSLRLPLDEIKGQADAILPNKSAEVILYCQEEGCQCAKEAIEGLTSIGYTAVFHYSQGVEGWVGAGYPGEPEKSSAGTAP